MTIAILYIATGRYRVFWPQFYTTLMQFFFPTTEKHIYVFSDSEPEYFTSHGENASCITHILTENRPWPFMTLFRYQIFLSAQEFWTKHDYVFFINADYAFYQPIGSEILPTAEESGLVVAELQKSLDLAPEDYPYERNPESLAFIPVGEGKHYLTGAFNGGTTSDFLELCRQINEATEADWKKGIVAVWHDESHLNAYLLHRKVKILPPWYVWPSYNTNQRNRHLVVAGPRDKLLYGGHEWLRGQTDKKKKSKFRRRLERYLIITASIVGCIGIIWFMLS